MACLVGQGLMACCGASPCPTKHAIAATRCRRHRAPRRRSVIPNCACRLAYFYAQNYNGTGATRSAAQKRFTATNNNPTVKTTFVRIVTMKIDTARGTFSRSEILT